MKFIVQQTLSNIVVPHIKTECRMIKCQRISTKMFSTNYRSKDVGEVYLLGRLPLK